MKTKMIRTWAAVGLPMVLATAAYRAPADDASAQATAAKPDKTYTGTVVSVDPKENMLEVKGMLFSSKEFNLGANCSYAIADRDTGSANDLRPGQRVVVSYQDVHGVPIVDRVTQKPMREKGVVTSIDPAAHKLTVHTGLFMDKTFQLPDNCDVTLHGGKSGAIADIQPGNHVTVTYEIPNGKSVARQIAQTSETFTGKLTAIDLNRNTVTAQATFSSKKFSVADNCAILVNGKAGGNLTDLRPDENLTFSYNDINGVNITDRIAPAQEPSPSSVAQNRNMGQTY